MTRVLLVFLLFFATSASAQVRVEWMPEKAAFLQGEPIFLVLRITNNSSAPIGYQRAYLDPILLVDEQESYAWRQGCRAAHSGAAGGSWASHPPVFAPGQTVTYRYLLRGYRLAVGTHLVRATGYLPVEIRDDRKYETKVEVTVVPADAQALREVFNALVKEGSNNLTRPGYLARAGLFSAAPADFTDAIARFAAYDSSSDTAHFPTSEGYEALADINSADSRAHLRRLYDETGRLDRRLDIVRALSRLSHPDSLDFLTSLLPGRSTKHDDAIRWAAVEGLQCIGGAAAGAAIVQGTKDWMDRDRRLEILGKLSPRDAVDAIIQIDAGGDLGALSATCGTLLQLTHYRWCDDDLIASVFTWPLDEKLTRPVIARIQSRWRPWWARNRYRIRMYRSDEPFSDPSPRKIW